SELLRTLVKCIVVVDFSHLRTAATAHRADDERAVLRIWSTLMMGMDDKRDFFAMLIANKLEELPPELLRAGRVDTRFVIGLPNEEERSEILSLSLIQLNQDPNRFAIAEHSAATEGFSGAELQNAIVSAAYDVLGNNEELT